MRGEVGVHRRAWAIEHTSLAGVKQTTILPVWLVVVLTVVPAFLTGAAAVLAAWLAGSRKAAKQLDTWRRREETMRLLRWATDKSTSRIDGERVLALAVLDALDNSKPTMLQEQDQGILDAVLDALLADATSVVEQYADDQGGYEVKVVPNDG